jgi:hypothetical protein
VLYKTLHLEGRPIQYLYLKIRFESGAIFQHQILGSNLFSEIQKGFENGVPSGKHTKNDGKSPFFMGKYGKSTISMAIFQ